MPNQVTVVAEFVALPGKAHEAREELKKLVAPTRREEGCLRYELNEVSGEAGRFFFVEDWASKAALDTHLQSAHLTAALERAATLFEKGYPRVALCSRVA